MIVSHRHKFIFIKTQKTAGTSIEIALSKFCGPDDIISRISSVDEKFRKSLGYPGAQNCYKPLQEYNKSDWYRQLIKLRRPKKFYNHMPASLIRQYVGNEVWNSYYKFCFERNPWDKAVSIYYWRNTSEDRISFTDYLEQCEDNGKRLSEYRLYTIDDKLAVDKVYKFEEIDSAMNDITERLQLPEIPLLPKTKTVTNKSRTHYSELYNETAKAYIQREFSREINLLNYKF
ncbi:MAG: sulfotransferase family 2 domain-containing protein [Gammaproteobacteria bacterium]|nr:sulfotransferase family 2 domain-containing protein [Gammaproteobacteria bacterium]MCW8840754.1 sulfotransferase family 2 domain-containing protein [Gammaproteobacteria bacterium]MCW8928272.1 sulfotransferase family 2 domain-containing protein [Gammaproteobacteria bacterium]MCW8959519.1 sulfotransferase family 2 domain-containing protein [Gammaproteobacteria bacterium]MCW8971757.1 sulfotransferase family 2 domain-containing protein [Gammaproteobacteria bacterium]